MCPWLALTLTLILEQRSDTKVQQGADTENAYLEMDLWVAGLGPIRLAHNIWHHCARHLGRAPADEDELAC